MYLRHNYTLLNEQHTWGQTLSYFFLLLHFGSVPHRIHKIYLSKVSRHLWAIYILSQAKDLHISCGLINLPQKHAKTREKKTEIRKGNLKKKKLQILFFSEISQRLSWTQILTSSTFYPKWFSPKYKHYSTNCQHQKESFKNLSRLACGFEI